MVQPNQLMVANDVLAVLNTLANSKASLPHKPYVISKFDPRREVNDRGAYDPSKTYNFGDQVSYGNNYLFIARVSGLTAPPLDPVTNNPNFGWVQPWQSCYQRVRDALHEAVSDANNGLELFRQSISGPWPCQFPDINYNNIEFYFADTGHAESVSISGTAAPGTAGCLGKMTVAQTLLPQKPINSFPAFNLPVTETGSNNPGDTLTDVAITDGQFKFQYCSACEFQIAIGGTQPLNLSATFQIPCQIRTGITFRIGTDLSLTQTTDPSDPSGYVTVDAGQFLPGATFVPSIQSTPVGYLLNLTCVINGTFNPGIYKVTVTSNRGPNNRASGTLNMKTNLDGSLTVTGSNEWAFDTFIDVSNSMSMGGTCGLTATTAVEVPGVHDTKKVFKIAAPPFNHSSGIPAGLWFADALYKYSDPAPLGNSSSNPPSAPNFQFGLLSIIPDTVAAGEIYTVVNNQPDTLKFVNVLFDHNLKLTVTASTAGYWFAITPPVSSLGLCPFDKMPWNIFPINIVGSPGTPAVNGYLGYKAPYFNGKIGEGFSSLAYSGDGPAWIPPTANNELLPWPKRWKSGVFYPAGFTILDANGNFQVCAGAGRSGGSGQEPSWAKGEGGFTTEPHVGAETGASWKLFKALAHAPTIARSTPYPLGAVGWDDFGNKQIVTVAGTSGNSSPNLHWSKTVGGLTVDGTVTWKVIYLGTIAPAVARSTPPNYPCFWQNPVAGQTDKPPVLTNPVTDGRGNRPYDFAPQGWWIYRVAINRIPQTKTTDKPSAVPIPVKIGCIRNGAFVSFGTFNSGQIINAYWPVFTNTALCYQASERVDIQAAIITCGTNYQKWGHVDLPFAATYLNDVEKLLGLLP